MPDFGGGPAKAFNEAQLDNINIQQARTNLGKSQLELANEQRMMGLMAGFKPSGGNITDSFEGLANLAASAGLYKQAEGLADKASLIRYRQAAQTTQEMRAGDIAEKSQMTRLDRAGRIISGATDPGSWLILNSQYEQLYNEPSPFRGMPYNPETVKALEASLTTTKDKLAAQARTKRDALSAQMTKRRMDHIDFVEGISERRTEAIEDRETRLGKTGGKPLARPAKGDIDDASAVILRDQFKGVDIKSLPDDAAEAVTQGALSIAEDAKRILRERPALKREQAFNQAYMTAKEAGEFQNIKGGFLQRDKTAFSSGQTPQSPLSLPAKGQKVVKGKWYTVGGKPYYYNGKVLLTLPEMEEAGSSAEIQADQEATGVDEGDEE